MGKKAREEKARQAQEERERQGFRRFLKIGAVTSVGLAAGGAAYLAHRSKKHESSSGYLTEDEAVEIYLELKKEVQKKWDEAQRKHKPLRIFVLEGHVSNNALAYEIMLMDIAKRQGIDTLMLEDSNDTIAGFLDPKRSAQSHLPDPNSEVHFRKILSKAVEKGYVHPVGMDNLWPTAPEFAEAMRSYFSRFMAEEIQKHYHVSNLRITITSDPEDQFLEHSSYKIGGQFDRPIDLSSNSPQSKEFNSYAHLAKGKAVDAMRKERNKTILETIKSYEDSLVITGKNHGVDILSPLRNGHEIDIAFSIANKDFESNYLKNPDVSDEQRKTLSWANDPANAIQYSGKDFNPENLPVFIERVIEKANSKAQGATR